MIVFANAVLPSPTVGRNFVRALKSLGLLGFCHLLEHARVRKPPERSAKVTQTGVENPWNSFAGRSL